MTNIYCQRHTEPYPGLPGDSTRILCPDGVKQAANMADWLCGQIGRVDIAIASPFARTMQTGEIMAEAMGCTLTDTTGLVPTAEPADMWKEIQRLGQQSKDILLVGHDPSLNRLMLWLMGFTGSQMDLRLNWGAIGLVQVTNFMTSGMGHGCLQWLVTPDLVERDTLVVEAARDLVASLE
jgi:phosphohistidine phosphatase SixA